MNWEEFAQIALVIVAVVTFLLGVWEYRRQGAQRRAEHFLTMAQRLEEDPMFKEICNWLESDDPKLKDVPYPDKVNFLWYFEAVAMLMHSDLVRKELVHYWFSYYALSCWESKNFWKPGESGFAIGRDSIYWILFKAFVEDMQQVEKDLLNKFERLRKKELSQRDFREQVIANLKI